jgi:hypothetical protein
MGRIRAATNELASAAGAFEDEEYVAEAAAAPEAEKPASEAAAPRPAEKRWARRAIAGAIRERGAVDTKTEPRERVKDRDNLGYDFVSILGQLRTVRYDVQDVYFDVAQRERIWRDFQELVSGPLWAAVERLEDDPYRQQLTDVLDAAVSKLEAFQLDERHLSALDSTLTLLSVPSMSEDAVDACERDWEAAEVTTLPALRASFEEWLTSSYSGIEDGG